MLKPIQIYTIQSSAEKEFSIFSELSNENDQMSVNLFYKNLKYLFDNPKISVTNNENEIQDNVGVIIYNAIRNPKVVFQGLADKDTHDAILLFKAKLLSCLLDKIINADKLPDQMVLNEINLDWVEKTSMSIRDSYNNPELPDMKFTMRPYMGYLYNFDIILVLFILSTSYYLLQEPNDLQKKGVNNILASIFLSAFLPTLGNLAYANFSLNRNRLFPPKEKCTEIAILLEWVDNQLQSKKSPQIEPGRRNIQVLRLGRDRQ